MGSLTLDIRYALRAIARRPGFALAAVLTLGLGIGATTAIFSVVNGVLLRALPYAAPDRIVALRNNTSFMNMTDVLAWNASFESGGGEAMQNFNWTGGDEPLELKAALVTGRWFETLGVRAGQGRTLGAADDRKGGDNVIVLSHGFWKRRLGGDRMVLGRGLTLSDKSYTVVGVMPPGFQTPGREVDLYAPLSVVQPDAAAYRGVNFLRTVWRLRPGVTAPQAQQDMLRLGQRLAEVAPDENRNRNWTILPLAERLVGDVRTALWILLGAVGLVLLVACSNFANLLLARSVGRSHELAVRASLGAGPVQLVRQLVTESVALSIAGGALGVAIAAWGVDLLLALRPDALPRLDDIRVDGMVLGFALALATITGLVFGLVPALHAAREAVAGQLKQGSRTTTTGGREHRLLDSMVVAQLALALVLLVGAGLLMHGLWRLSSVRPGFDPDGVLTMRIELPDVRYPDQDAQTRYRHAVLDAVGSIPGAHVGLVSELPLSGDALMHNFIIGGRPQITVGDEPELMSRSVAGDYFAAMRISVLSGRVFGPADRAGAPLVGVVNPSFAREYTRGNSPIGERIRWSHADGEPQWITIVGVVADVRHFGLAVDEQPAVYTPYEQVPQEWKRWQTLVVRAPGVTSGAMVRLVKQRVWSVDSSLPITAVQPMKDVIAASLASQNFNLTLIGIFAAVALLLACFGLYGVVSYVAERRTREIGLRLALGAGRRDVFGLVLGRSLRLVAIGVAVGLAGASAVTGLMRSMLFEVSAHDPWTYGAVAATLALVAVAATAAPALRASRVDPVIALRSE